MKYSKQVANIWNKEKENNGFNQIFFKLVPVI